MASIIADLIRCATPRNGMTRFATGMLLIGFAAINAHAQGADTTRTAPSAIAASNAAQVPSASEVATPSDSCTELGSAARAVAAWRDAGGAAWMAKAKLDQRIAEPTVRDAAQQLVDTLYTPTMRKLRPDETALAVAQSCMAAKTPSSVTAPSKPN